MCHLCCTGSLYAYNVEEADELENDFDYFDLIVKDSNQNQRLSRLVSVLYDIQYQMGFFTSLHNHHDDNDETQKATMA
jgi:hypothetical protein